MLFLLCLFLATATANLIEDLRFSYEGMKNCDGFSNTKVRVEDLVMEQISKNKMAISGVIVTEVPLSHSLIVKAHIAKCPSKTERGLCEDIPPKIISDTCEKMKDKKAQWHSFIEKMENFTPACPVEPGRFPFKEYVADLEDLSEMPQMKGYWILTTEGYIDGTKMMCIVGEFNFESVGKKTKKIKAT